jgi:hypothetical protein
MLSRSVRMLRYQEFHFFIQEGLNFVLSAKHRNRIHCWNRSFRDP